MYKIIFVVFLFSKSLILFSADDCYFNLLGRKWGNSYNHTILRDGLTPLDQSSVISAIAKTLVKLKCTEPLSKDAVIGCHRILSTSICRVDYIYGYFMVFPDGAESYNMVFSRWD